MKAVPSLQRRIATIRATEKDESINAKLETLKSELNNIRDLFSTVKKNQDELLDTLTLLDTLLRALGTKHFIDIANRILQYPHDQKDQKFHNPDEKQDQNKKKMESLEKRVELMDQALDGICKSIKDSAEKLKPGVCGGGGGGASQSRQESGGGRVNSTLHVSQIMNNELVGPVLKRIQVSYDNLNLRSKVCLLCLTVFPENVVMKKRHTIYWWIGEGFVRKTGEKTAEEAGEDVFDELLSCHLIAPHGNGKCPIVNKFKLNPWIRHMLLSSVLGENDHHLFGFYSQLVASSSSDQNQHACLVLDQQKVRISDADDLGAESLKTIFNVGGSYLNFGSKWMEKAKKLVVLQLGRWQDSPSHHIEVESGEFLKDMKAQKHLKYLSLRGISRISNLPSSVVQELVSLEILDLKACHNLETLPDDIASLRRLTHLDVSQCYLLESMPKGIEKLTELQVLKGFVIGSSSKTPCRISDLAKLKKLTRLSIHIGSEAVIQDKEFESLKDLSQVKRLKISWAVSGNQDFSIIFPEKLEKLDIEGFPGQKIPGWLRPGNLPEGLKKLYIKGGQLTSLDHGETGSKWFVQIVRLRYLKYLKSDPDLKKLFPSPEYAEKKQVLNLSSE